MARPTGARSVLTVVAAIVETHGRRRQPNRAEGIELIPPRIIEYHGGRIFEPMCRQYRHVGGCARR